MNLKSSMFLVSFKSYSFSKQKLSRILESKLIITNSVVYTFSCLYQRICINTNQCMTELEKRLTHKKINITSAICYQRNPT